MSPQSANTVLPLIFAALALQSPCAWAWTTVGVGIEYQAFHLSDPNNLFVARMDRHNPQVILDSSIGQGRLSCCAETVRSQAIRYQDALSHWGNDIGQRNGVVVAINGDFWNTSTGVPTGGQVISGWYAKDVEPAYGFFYSTSRHPMLRQAAVLTQRVTFVADNFLQNINGINRARGADELILYTSHYDTTTLTSSAGTEVLVELNRPNLTGPSSDITRGRIRQIRQNLGSTQIPFDHVVLSATGTQATTLLAHASVNGEVNITNYLQNLPAGELTFASVGGGEVFLTNDFVVGGQAILNPRTAIAYNDDYIFFVVVDGRSSTSVGMTMTQLGNFCQTYLGASWGMNLDGGGSSTMVVNGAVKNVPSDGSERAVSNGLMMMNLAPKIQTTVFNSGDHIKTTLSTSMRLGPGSQYSSIATVPANTQGTILDHSLRGILAKGSNWWKCDFGGTNGWVVQTNLGFVSSSGLPVFSTHPVSQQICPGAPATFTASATGSGLTYKWQRNGIDLTDTGHVSGAASTALSITGTDVSDQGSYRCIATGAGGQTTSYSAGLTIREATLISGQPADQAIYPLGSVTTAVFSAAGMGEGALNYQWQRNNIPLSDGAHFSGATSPTLTVLSADTSLAGIYRCEITAGCGPAYTNGAQLVSFSPDFDSDGDADISDFALLQLCLGQTQLQQSSSDCLRMDLDHDNRVDANDVVGFANCLSGPGTVLPQGC